jgi:hypothetical protein
MRRVKDYNTFLIENKLLSNIASKQMTRILDPNYESKAKVKTQAEVESSFGNDEKGNPMGVWDFWKWDDKKNGFVATSPTFSGEVTLKEIDNEGDVTRIYEVTSGTNNGLKGNFTWESTTAGSKYPKFGEPADKKWSDVLGPDENFLKTFVSPQVRWASNISEIDGVKLKKVGLNGVYEIEYEDKFQFFGNVRIYYSANQEDPFVNSFYSYEVKDGPNKGAKGKGFQIFTEKQNSAKIGIYNPFSDGDVALKVIQYPAISHADREKNDPIKTNSINGGTGIKPDQLIFFNTSDLSSIKGPIQEVMFDELNFDYGSIPDYSPNKALIDIKGMKGNKIFGKIEKSKLPSTPIYCLQKTSTPVEYKGKNFPSLDGIQTTECYISCYQGQPLILYTVEAKKKDSPSFDNKGVGTYGNRFFSGIFYDKETDIASQVRGEWYYDYLLDEIGIIYAYGVNDKKEIKQISNGVRLNLGSAIQKEITKLSKEAKEKQKEAEKTANNSRTSPFGPK